MEAVLEVVGIIGRVSSHPITTTATELVRVQTERRGVVVASVKTACLGVHSTEAGAQIRFASIGRREP